MDSVFPVPFGSIAGMIFSLIIGFGLPVVLCIYFNKKKGASLSSFFIGCITFYLFAMILEQILHKAVLTAGGEALTGNIWLYALYGGLAAAVFEETGRYLAMKYFMKNRLNRENALMYGAGHGGIEAILLLGLTSVNNLMISASINAGQLEGTLAAIPEEQKAATLQSLSVLWTLPSYQFFLGGVERILAVALHIALSVLVYQAVKGKRIQFFLLALLLHFLVDASTVAASRFLPTAVIELIVLVFVAFSVYLAFRVYRRDTDE